MERGRFRAAFFSPTRGMPAAKAGIMAGDIITHLDDAAHAGSGNGSPSDCALDHFSYPQSQNFPVQNALRCVSCDVGKIWQ